MFFFIYIFPSVFGSCILFAGAAVGILFAINMANIWEIRGAPYGAQWRVPTNFIQYIFALMLVLLSYHRLYPRSGPAFEKIAFNYNYGTLLKFRSSAGCI